MSLRTPVPRRMSAPPPPPKRPGWQRNILPMVVVGALFLVMTHNLNSKKAAYELEEMFRVPGPDKRVDAVVLRHKMAVPPGYTTHRVQVVAAGQIVRKDDEPHGLFYGAERYDGGEGVDVRWLPGGVLEVRYKIMQGGALNAAIVQAGGAAYRLELTSR